MTGDSVSLSCSACGATSIPGGAFCSKCGSNLLAECPRCGAALRAESRFCPGCGNKLTARRAPVPEPAAAATAEPALQPAAEEAARLAPALGEPQYSADGTRWWTGTQWIPASARLGAAAKPAAPKARPRDAKVEAWMTLATVVGALLFTGLAI